MGWFLVKRSGGMSRKPRESHCLCRAASPPSPAYQPPTSAEVRNNQLWCNKKDELRKRTLPSYIQKNWRNFLNENLYRSKVFSQKEAWAAICNTSLWEFIFACDFFLFSRIAYIEVSFYIPVSRIYISRMRIVSYLELNIFLLLGRMMQSHSLSLSLWPGAWNLSWKEVSDWPKALLCMG